MPDYCRSCPYNKFCKDDYIPNPTCPFGYSPVGLNAKAKDEQEPLAEASQIYKTEIIFKIAKAAINKNDYQTAIGCYEKVLELQPNNPEASFLLRRTRYMANGKETSPLRGAKSKHKKKDDETEQSSKGSATLPHQELKKISIRPTQHLKVDRELIGPDTEKVYGVEQTQDLEELEDLSKNVAIRLKGKIKRKNRPMVIIALCLAILFGLIFALWFFGYL